jgi:hypothetical protein
MYYLESERQWRRVAPSIRPTNRASERKKPYTNQGVIDGGGVDGAPSRGTEPTHADPIAVESFLDIFSRALAGGDIADETSRESPARESGRL